MDIDIWELALRLLEAEEGIKIRKGIERILPSIIEVPTSTVPTPTVEVPTEKIPIPEGMILKWKSGPPIDIKNLTISGYYDILELPPKENFPYKMVMGRVRNILMISDSPEYNITIKQDGDEKTRSWYDYKTITLADNIVAGDTKMTFSSDEGEVTVYLFILNDVKILREFKMSVYASGVRFRRIYADFETLVLAPLIEE